MTFLHRIARGAQWLAPGLLLLALFGCAGMNLASDPRSAADIATHAERLVASKAYAKAAEQYAIVIAKEPTVGRHYLRRAELLERVDADKEAYQTYRQALKKVPDEDPDRITLLHRLALIDANHLFRIAEAEEILKKLPDKSIEQLDLAAFLYYRASQYDQSIALLNKALERVRSADQKALLLYHAALVYVKTGDQKNTFGSLYYSINNAEHLGLIRDIEQLWQQINEPPKPEPGS